MKKALLVGINYIGTTSELRGCINDVNNMSNLLLSKGYHCKILTDNSRDKPTRKNIIACFDWLLAQNPNEIFFHYSGHGSWMLDKNKEERDGKDETICPIDFEKNGMITDDEIKQLLVNRIPKTARLISIIDACHSETSFDLKYVYKIPSASSSKFSLEVNNYNETSGKIIMISGCKDPQTSADIFIENQYQGALTYSFIKVLAESQKFKTIIENINSLIRTSKISEQIPCLSFGRFADFNETF